VGSGHLKREVLATFGHLFDSFLRVEAFNRYYETQGGSKRPSEKGHFGGSEGPNDPLGGPDDPWGGQKDPSDDSRVPNHERGLREICSICRVVGS